MTAAQLEKYRRRLKSRTPLIGGWLRRNAARALARDRDPRAVRLLAEELLVNTDQPMRDMILKLLGDVNRQGGIDQICEVWSHTRDPGLESMIVARGWVASEPIAVRVLSALACGRVEALRRPNEAMVDSLVSACVDQDPRIAAAALGCIREPGFASALALLAERICTLWFHTRQPVLADLMVERGLVASSPIEVRVASALKCGQDRLLEDAGVEVVEALRRAVDDSDPAVRAGAGEVLLNLHNSSAASALCDLFLEDGDQVALSAARSAGYLPSDGLKQALFLFLAEDWKRYQELDFDQSMLRTVYESGDENLRLRIQDKMRQSGRADFASVLIGSDYRSRAAVMTPRESELLVGMLVSRGDWPRLWSLVFELSLEWSVRIIRELGSGGFCPPGGDEGEVFVTLGRLAASDLALPGQNLQTLIPPAIRRARVKVPGRVNDMAFHPADPVLAVGTGSGKVVWWNFQAMARERVQNGFEHSIGRVVFMPDGSLLCAERTNRKDTCGVFRVTDGVMRRLGEHRGTVTVLKAAGESRALSAGRDRRAVLWNLESGRSAVSREFNFWAREASVSDNAGQALLLHNGVSLVSLPGLEERASIPRTAWKGVARCAAFAPGDHVVIIGTHDGRVMVCDLIDRQLQARNPHLAEYAGQVQGIEVLARHLVALSAGSDGSIRFDSWENRASAGRVHSKGERLTSLRISPGGEFMAVGDADAAVSLWDLRPLDVRGIFDLPFARSAPVHLEAIGALLACESLDPRLVLSLRYLETVLRHRFRYDIDIDEVISIKAGEFDIEIE